MRRLCVGLRIILFMQILFRCDGAIDVTSYFPLKTGTCWEFDGLAIASGERFINRICVEPQETMRGIKVTPLLFTKNKASGYWGPGANLNLRWFIVNFGKKQPRPSGFLYALGDERYQRDSHNWQTRGKFDSSILYVSSDILVPAYVLFPKRILPPNYLFIPDQGYYTTHDRLANFKTDAVSFESAHWSVTYDRTVVNTPAYKGNAVQIHFEENFNGRGWVERWYFADKIGPVQIETFVQGEVFSADNLPPIRHQLKLRRVFKQIK